MKIGDVVQVLWIDSVSDSRTWMQAAYFNFAVHDAAMLHVSTGFLINKTKDAIYLTMSLRAGAGRGDVYGGVFSIPCVAVKKTRRLK